jgi:hypothetical protein
MIAVRTGCDDIRPYVFSTQVTRDDVIDGQGGDMPAAILAGGVIAPEHFAAGKLDPRAGMGDLVFKTNDGGQVEKGVNRVDLPTAVDHKAGFI